MALGTNGLFVFQEQQVMKQLFGFTWTIIVNVFIDFDHRKSQGPLLPNKNYLDVFMVVQSCSWRRKWQPTPIFLPGESQGWRSLLGCHLWDRTESDTTEATQQQQQSCSIHLICIFVYVTRDAYLHFIQISYICSKNNCLLNTCS